jgi:TonB family protein
MPILHVVDRANDLGPALESRLGLGAFVSGASHIVLVTLLVLAWQFTPARSALTDVNRLDTQKLVWWPQPKDGGGRSSAGDGTTAARPAQARGADAITVPDVPTPSSAITDKEIPVELTPLAAVPMALGSHMLPGPIVASDAAATAIGGTDGGPGGDGPGRSPGNGNGPNGPGFGDGAHRGGPGVTTPVLIHQVKPRYTANAMRAKVQGSVWLECVVLPDGTVGDLRVARSLDRVFGLDEEAIAAARQWRFRPGLLKGQPVAVLVTIQLDFTVR